MTTMVLRSLLASAALAALFAAPAAAQPALIEPLKSCYVVAQEDQREPISLVAGGFTPFATVDVLIDDIVQYQAQALLDGTVVGPLRAPYQEEGTRPFELRVSELGNPLNTLVERTMVTRLAVEQTPKRARTGQRVRFKGRGFTNLTAPIYAHYVFAGKARKSVRLGLPKDPCGTFNVRRKQFPFKKSPRVGVWTIQFDQNPRYDANAAVRVPLTVKVRKTPKQASAQGRPRAAA